MTNAQELARAVQQEVRSIIMSIDINRAQANAMLRIEAAREAFWKLEETDARTGYFDHPFDHSNGLAPRKFLGVTVYPVDFDMPAPGWRIVNPLKAK